MEFINVILKNCELKEAKIFNAAQKAAANPEIGITIQNKAAYHVIKDCAAITMQYLPHLAFGSYQNPFKSLKGKIKKDMIVEFIEETENNSSLKQLLYIILAKAEELDITSPTNAPIGSKQFELTDNTADPYGDYGSEQLSLNRPDKKELMPLDILCAAFA